MTDAPLPDCDEATNNVVEIKHGDIEQIVCPQTNLVPVYVHGNSFLGVFCVLREKISL